MTTSSSFSSETTGATYLVPERKPRSGTILDFGLRILDFKKENNFSALIISEQSRKTIFRGFRSGTI